MYSPLPKHQVMGSRLSLVGLLLFSAIFSLLLLQNQLVAHSIIHHIQRPRTPTKVTKRLFFPNFNSNLNPHTNQEYIKLLGSAKISDGVIHIPDASLTVDPTYQAGRAIYASPIRLFDSLTQTPASFQTTFSFKFTASTHASVSNEGHGGNGLAFVIVLDEFTVGRSGPWLGIVNDACDDDKVFAVEFGTSHNPEFGDPNYDDHVCVNLGSVVSFKAANTSKAKVSLHSNIVHRAWIAYDSQERRIDVHLGSDGDTKSLEPVLSVPLNLSPFLKEYMFVGFSASTGNSTQIHGVLSWNFSSTNEAFLPEPSGRIFPRNVARQVSKYNHIGFTSPPKSFMIFVAITGLCTVALICFYCNSIHRDSTMSQLTLLQKPTQPSKPRRYTFVEVFIATRRFSELEMLGSDCRGAQYRGTLPNGSHVAVKRFSRQLLNTSRLGTSRILKRIGELAHLSHHSLAQIRGWCIDNIEAIIVYDYFRNGNLDRWLYVHGFLPWSRRLKVIKEIAEALCFLHSNGLAHGNLKTSNVFIDVDHQAVLGDYGFISFLGDSGQIVSDASKSADVFGFGMLLLETLAGKKTEKHLGGGESEMGLLEFAWSMHETGQKAKVIDERVGPCANSEQALRVLEIGLSCTLNTNNGRPCMEEVVQFLNTQKSIPKLPPSRPCRVVSKAECVASSLGVGKLTCFTVPSTVC